MARKEGPTASVSLTCWQCKHYKMDDENWNGPATCVKANRIVFTHTPDWCPFHPGEMVAMKVSAHKVD